MHITITDTKTSTRHSHPVPLSLTAGLGLRASPTAAAGEGTLTPSLLLRGGDDLPCCPLLLAGVRLVRSGLFCDTCQLIGVVMNTVEAPIKDLPYCKTTLFSLLMILQKPLLICLHVNASLTGNHLCEALEVSVLTIYLGSHRIAWCLELGSHRIPWQMEQGWSLGWGGGLGWGEGA